MKKSRKTLKEELRVAKKRLEAAIERQYVCEKCKTSLGLPEILSIFTDTLDHDEIQEKRRNPAPE